MRSDRELGAGWCPWVQLVIAALLTGLIWTVQRVVYPQFALVPAEAFPSYHERYTSQITLLVGPLMMVELVLAAWTVWRARQAPLRVLWLLASALCLATWLLTGLVQVPQHEALAKGLSDERVQALVQSNGFRTLAWSLRLALLVFLCARFRASAGAVSRTTSVT